MKVIITGDTGFVGVNLKNYLQISNQIFSLKVRYDATQKIELKGDAVIHLAGKVHDLKNVSNYSDYYEANFELTKQLFDAFLISDVSVFIFMSSVKASADKVMNVLTEEIFPNPKTYYGITKQKAEKYILSKELSLGKRVYILRPCMIHGVGNKGNLNLLYQLVAKGVPWPLGAFENKRSFLSIENLCFVIKELLENKDTPSGIYHVADDESLSTNEVINLLGISLGKKSRIWKISPFLVISLAKLGNYLHLPLNTERLQKLTENYIVSNAKLKKELKKELPVSAKEGLIKTFNSFKVKNKI